MGRAVPIRRHRRVTSGVTDWDPVAITARLMLKSPQTGPREDMALLHLTLLGGFEARAGDASPVVFARRKAQALLAYLAVDPGEAHLRDKLAALLWGESSDQRARHSLRQTLSALKQTLGRNGGDVLRVDADTVAINRAAIRVDVDVLKQLVTEATPEALAQATALYRGDFLEGLSVREPRFEEWLITQRELLRELALEALAKLLAHQTKTGATQQAIQTAVRLLGLDPLQEAVHRALMRLYAQQGRRGAALRQYQICVAELQRELGQEPEAPTKRLYEEILQAQRAPAVRASPSAIADDSVPYGQPEVCIDASVSDAPLVGREGQMAALLHARAEAWRGQARMAAVLGEAGIGKSRLIDAFVTDTLEHGGRVVLGRAHETERILPFGLWVDAFRTAGLLPELARHPGLSAAGGRSSTAVSRGGRTRQRTSGRRGRGSCATLRGNGARGATSREATAAGAGAGGFCIGPTT